MEEITRPPSTFLSTVRAPSQMSCSPDDEVDEQTCNRHVLLLSRHSPTLLHPSFPSLPFLPSLPSSLSSFSSHLSNHLSSPVFFPCSSFYYVSFFPQFLSSFIIYFLSCISFFPSFLPSFLSPSSIIPPFSSFLN